VILGFLVDGLSEKVLCLTRPLSEFVAKIDLAVTSQARSEFPICGEAKFVAGGAEVRRSHRSDQADHGPGGSITEVAGWTITPEKSRIR
jgi:hypothetical protein